MKLIPIVKLRMKLNPKHDAPSNGCPKVETSNIFSPAPTAKLDQETGFLTSLPSGPYFGLDDVIGAIASVVDGDVVMS